MRRGVTCIATVFWALACQSAFVSAGQTGAPPPDQTRLQTEIERIAKSRRDVIGVTAYHVESGQTVSVRGADQFPMASVYKVPIAVQFLHLVELQQASLDEPVTITAAGLTPGHGALARLMKNGEVTLTTRELVELMITNSDNTSSDIILRMAGGPAAVTARMRGLGITDMGIDRSVIEMLLDENGVAERPAMWTREGFTALFDSVTPAVRRAARAVFIADRRDAATPNSMVHLLYLIHQRIALRQPHADWLIGLMESAGTGGKRLKGLLPRATPVAHKTGTLDCCVNDAGIVTLPNGKGHVVIAVFVKGLGDSGAARQAVIAQLSRATYEGWSGERLPRVAPKPVRRARSARASRGAATSGRPTRRSPAAASGMVLSSPSPASNTP